jgi:hypothetical protein
MIVVHHPTAPLRVKKPPPATVLDTSVLHLQPRPPRGPSSHLTTARRRDRRHARQPFQDIHGLALPPKSP